ncbi:MAG: hypothetical protein ABSG91_11635 [Syntrophobacteraceae bacterium]|jgi:hypothetical protein
MEAFLEVYIVRIYRRDESDPRMVAGIVEEPWEPVRPFADIDELSDILTKNRPQNAGPGVLKKDKALARAYERPEES